MPGLELDFELEIHYHRMLEVTFGTGRGRSAGTVLAGPLVLLATPHAAKIHRFLRSPALDFHLSTTGRGGEMLGPFCYARYKHHNENCANSNTTSGFRNVSSRAFRRRVGFFRRPLGCGAINQALKVGLGGVPCLRLFAIFTFSPSDAIDGRVPHIKKRHTKYQRGARLCSELMMLSTEQADTTAVKNRYVSPGMHPKMRIA